MKSFIWFFSNKFILFQSLSSWFSPNLCLHKPRHGEKPPPYLSQPHRNYPAEIYRPHSTQMQDIDDYLDMETFVNPYDVNPIMHISNTAKVVSQVIFSWQFLNLNMEPERILYTSQGVVRKGKVKLLMLYCTVLLNPYRIN